MNPPMDAPDRHRYRSSMWHVELKRRYGSNRKAAANLFPRWRKRAKAEVERDGTTEVALANRIGLLAREGDRTGWWADRPKLCEDLADLLEMELEDIFVPAERNSGDLVFREFPRLPRLQRSEGLCRTSPRGSVFDVAVAELAPGRHAWITVPPGGGKSAAIQLFRARFGADVDARTGRTLRDALGALPPTGDRAVVVQIDERDPTDGRCLATLEAIPSVVVLAPFDRPSDGEVGALGMHPSPWTAIDGSPGSGLRDRMLEWIEERLADAPGDGKLDCDEVRTRIARDPTLRDSLLTPGDLLAFCADVDREGLNDEPAGAQAARWLRVTTPSLVSDAPRVWTEQLGTATVHAFDADFADLHVAWGSRSLARWPEVIPAGAEGGLRHPQEGEGLTAVGYMRLAGLIRGGARGAVGYPAWVARGIADERLQRLFEAPDVGAWGCIAADASRQEIVDAALDRLAAGPLSALGASVLERAQQRGARPSLAVVAAIEAASAAVARRLVAGEESARLREVGRKLLLAQLQHLVPANGAHAVPRPLTRLMRDEWFLTGWAISLAAEPAPRHVPRELAWILPGWVENLSVTTADPLVLPWSSMGPPRANRAVRGLVRLASDLLRRLKPETPPANTPRILMPAMFLAGTWPVGRSHLEVLAGTWEEAFLAAAAKSLSGDERARLATKLWELAGREVAGGEVAPVCERLAYLAQRHRPLLPFVIEGLPTAAVYSTARDAGIHRRYDTPTSFTESDPREMVRLTPPTRAAAVRGWLEASRPPDARWAEAQALAVALDDPDDSLLQQIREADALTAAAFAERMWRHHPERALRETRATYEGEKAAAAGWFEPAPRDYLAALVDLVRRAGPAPWVPSWALRHIADGGPQAQALYELSAVAR